MAKVSEAQKRASKNGIAKIKAEDSTLTNDPLLEIS